MVASGRLRMARSHGLAAVSGLWGQGETSASASRISCPDGAPWLLPRRSRKLAGACRPRYPTLLHCLRLCDQTGLDLVGLVLAPTLHGCNGLACDQRYSPVKTCGGQCGLRLRLRLDHSRRKLRVRAWRWLPSRRASSKGSKEEDLRPGDRSHVCESSFSLVAPQRSCPIRERNFGRG